MFGVKGRVMPVTLDDTQIAVKLANGETIVGETNIDIPKHDPNIAITDAFLEGEGNINPKAYEAIINADYVIIGPGDIYSSIVPALLCKGMQQAFSATKAKIVYVCNIMTKHGETTGFEVEDFVDVIAKYAGRYPDYVIVNNGYIHDDLVEKYKREENKKPVKVKNIEAFANKPYTIIERDLVNENDYIRHNSEKLHAVIEDLIEGWIK